VIITRKDPFTGKTNTMDLDITEDQLEAWHAGQLIQHALPRLNADEREFLMTGMMPESWDELFEEDDNSEEEDAIDFDCPVCGLEGGH
jgi:hypothetical protein